MKKSPPRVMPTTPVADGSPVFSLEAYMANAQTRIYSYNGHKLVSLLGRETFPGERCHKLPPKIIEFASRQPLTSALLPCRIGYFPNARDQKVSRPNGDWAFTLLFCVNGHGHLNLARQSYPMTRGSLALLRPFEFHAYEAAQDHPWSYYWIHFNGSLAQQYYDVLTDRGLRPCLPIEPDVCFIQGFENILGIYRQGHAYHMLMRASAALHQLLGDLYGILWSKADTSARVDTRIDRTIELIAGQPAMHVSIQELAASVNMSQTYYTLQFRRRTGESPRTYFNKLRIEKARACLQATDTKIELVANLVGFEDAFYFSRLFKRLTGLTPSECRRAALARRK